MNESKFEPIALPNEIRDFFLKISEHLKYENRFRLPKDLSTLVERFVERQIFYGQKVIEKDSIFFRARIGEPGMLELFHPDNMGAPPRGKAGSGRINPEGISYLYLADSPDTAIAEVRPWKGARISVATFTTTKPLNIVSFSAGDSMNEDISEADLEKAELRDDAIDMINGAILKALYFSSPAHHNDKYSYLASQYIAEIFKEHGVNGLEYNSVLHEGGTNTALFDVSSASCLKVDGYFVERVDYNTTRLIQTV